MRMFNHLVDNINLNTFIENRNRPYSVAHFLSIININLNLIIENNYMELL